MCICVSVSENSRAFYPALCAQCSKAQRAAVRLIANARNARDVGETEKHHCP